MLRNHVPELLRQKFGATHVSDTDLAEAVGLHRITIKVWRETPVFSQVRYEALVAWCRYFNVGIDGVLSIERGE